MDWFRMYHEFATDPKVQMLSEVDQRRFVMLLCLKSSNRDVTLHETEVAFQLRVTPEELAETKANLVAKNLVDEDLQPVAWDKRQFVSDSSAARVSRHRSKKKQGAKQGCNVTVTPPDTDTDTDTDNKNTEFFPLAERIWQRVEPITKAKPPNMKVWANDLRLIVERDGRTLEDVERIFNWANKNDFWRKNILSPNKLRRQFPVLYAQACEKSNSDWRKQMGAA